MSKTEANPQSAKGQAGLQSDDDLGAFVCLASQSGDRLVQFGHGKILRDKRMVSIRLRGEGSGSDTAEGECSDEGTVSHLSHIRR